MKLLTEILAICIAAYFILNWINNQNTQSPQKLQTPYIAIYGRDTCSRTNKMKQQLETANIPFHYYNIDNREIADYIHSEMHKVGIKGKYNLPVVDVNGYISTNPKFDLVRVRYQESLH